MHIYIHTLSLYTEQMHTSLSLHYIRTFLTRPLENPVKTTTKSSTRNTFEEEIRVERLRNGCNL